jgi:hypothetical protein
MPVGSWNKSNSKLVLSVTVDLENNNKSKFQAFNIEKP